jgi:hypothetical protein
MRNVQLKTGAKDTVFHSVAAPGMEGSEAARTGKTRIGKTRRGKARHGLTDSASWIGEQPLRWGLSSSAVIFCFIYAQRYRIIRVMIDTYVTREYLRTQLLRFEVRVLGYFVVVILANHFWK